MKNITGLLSKIFTAVAVVPIVSLSLIACTNKKDDSSNNQSVTNQSQQGNSENQNTNVNDGEESANKLSGIYNFADSYNLGDLVYADQQELFDFFGTRDMNGVKAQALKHGINSFISNIYKEGENKLSIFVQYNESEQAYTWCYVQKTAENEYSLVSESENAAHTKSHIAKLENGAFISTEDPILSYDEETNELTLLHQFTYTENDELVETPLYVKTTLTAEPNTEFPVYNENALGAFKANSATINAPEGVSAEDSLKEVATLLSLDPATATIESINEYISTKFSDNMLLVYNPANQRFIFQKGTTSISYIAPNEAGEYSIIPGANFTVQYNAETNELLVVTSLSTGATFEVTIIGIGAK